MSEEQIYYKKAEAEKRIVLTDRIPYLDARAQVETLPLFKRLKVWNMPRLIETLSDAGAKGILRYGIDTISGEFQFKYNNDRIYAVAHGEHPFSSVKALADRWRDQSYENHEGFMKITEKEIGTLLKEAVSISDVVKGTDASDKTIIINMDKDAYVIHKSDFLNQEEWLSDYRVLAVCGNKENRRLLGNKLFEFGMHVASVHYLYDENTFNQNVGHLIRLGALNSGISPSPDLNVSRGGRFGASTIVKYPQKE
jgi:hypothetical protein